MIVRRVVLLTCGAARLLAAQTDGELVGRVRESWGRGVGIGGARVAIVGTALGAVTDGKGRYRIRAVPSGEYTVRVTAAGYTAVEGVTVPVRVATETGWNAFLAADTMPGAEVPAPMPVVDPHLVSARQRWDAAALAALPVWSLEEAVGLWSGVTGQSYRAGRPGSQLIVVDGIPLRAAFDASTAPLGLRLPAALVQEVSLAPSELDVGAHPGLGGTVTAVTRTGGARWTGAVGYFTDRPVGGAADLGTDRLLIRSDGPLGAGARVAAVLEATGRLQADASSAPPGDPATPAPWQLAHNSGESIDGAATLQVRLGETYGLRVLGVHSRERRLRFDPAFKYDPASGSARQITATLVGGEVRRTAPGLAAAARVSYFAREHTESELTQPVDLQFGAFGGEYAFRGYDLARARDTAGTVAPLAGFDAPAYSDHTPWGVPAFFLAGGSRGNLLWNRYRELQVGLRVTTVGHSSVAWSADAGVTLADAEAFQRILAFLPVGDSVPPATAPRTRPVAFALGGRVRRGAFGATALIVGLRLDGLAPRGTASGDVRLAVSPHVQVVVPTGNVTLAASVARISRFPDLQFVSDVAFDDSLAGGRFRHGDADLGYEAVTAGELGLRWRFSSGTAFLSAYVKHLDHLVASDDVSLPDSASFGNRDDAEVAGAELRVQRAFGSRAWVTATYVVESGSYAAIDGYREATPRRSDFLHRLVFVADAPLPWDVRAAGALHVRSGLAYPAIAPVDAPTSLLVDLLLRRPFRVAGRVATVYLDVRNALNDRPVVGVWRATGAPELDPATIEAMAQDAYAAGPAAIPYESRYYRAGADADGNGVIEGEAELLPQYRAAAADAAQPLRAYGAPRTIRFGLELAL